MWRTILLALLLTGCVASPKPSVEGRLVEPSPHPLAVSEWQNATKRQLSPGATVTEAKTVDTRVELYEFDTERFGVELYDQDEDDAVPFDNAATLDLGVEDVVQRLKSRGTIVLAWNGPFFAYDHVPEKIGRHIGPVVLRRKLRYNVGNHRWTLGIKGGVPSLMHLPSRAELEGRQFDYAVAGVQCLIVDGKPLGLEPFPARLDSVKDPPVQSTPGEAGHIPLVDHMQTSRTSIAWHRGGKKMFVLLVFEADHELGSKLGLKRGEAQEGGWTLDDLQRFWLKKGVAFAINSDGGDVTQRAVMRGEGYDVVQPKSREGTLMTFYVRKL